MEIPFDNNSGERYVLDVITSEIETGDGVVLTLNKNHVKLSLKFSVSWRHQRTEPIFIWVTTNRSRKGLDSG